MKQPLKRLRALARVHVAPGRTVTATLRLKASDLETIPPRDLAGPTRAADFDDESGIRLVDETKASGDAVTGPYLVLRGETRLTAFSPTRCPADPLT